MEIGNLFKAKEPELPPELFLAIQIQEGLVKTAVWQVASSKPEVISYGTPQKWADTESLLVAVDTSLTTALESQENEPDRVIFGLPESWIKEDKITPDSSGYLKELISKLSLKPIGFVVITEAVIQQLKLQEGIPPTAILLELHSTKVNVVVTKLGEVVGREEVGRSEDLAKDVQEGLTRLEIDQLPARMIIINGQDPELEQQLTSFPWQENLSFLHLPKVETPDPKFSIKAVALSGGSEAARSLGIEVQEPEVIDPPAENTTPPPPTDHATPAVESLGFVVGQDIRKVQSATPISPAPTSAPKARGTAPSLNINSIFLGLKSRLTNLKKPSFPSGTDFKKPVFFIIPAVLLLTIFTLIFTYGSLSKAQITLYVEPKVLDKSFNIAIADTPDQDLPTIPATAESIELSASGSIPTSGEALVGEKSSGKLTIYNRTNIEKTLESGTILATDANLKYVLDSTVTVASKSADLDYNEVPGKVDATVTASSIGADYNIDNNIELAVGSFPKSSLVAKTTADFSGGTSRTVKAVSKSDRQNLLDQLTEKIKEDAVSKLPTSSEHQIVPQDVEVITQDFSAAIGEETGTLSLELKGKANFLRFKQSALNTIVELQINSDIPAGYVFNPDDTEISVKPPTTDQTTNLVTTTATVKANLIPDLPITDYQKQLKGKSVSTADRLLQNVPGYKKLTILISPKLPFLSTRLPNNPDKIDFEIKSITP